jgi:hypothetical protein
MVNLERVETAETFNEARLHPTFSWADHDFNVRAGTIRLKFPEKKRVAYDLHFLASMKRTLVVIRTPCGADWNSMSPRGSARLCASCDKLVHDLSAMSESDARRLLRGTDQSLCVRYLYDQTGDIWFAEHFERRHSRAKLGVAAAAAALAGAAPLLTQACGGAALDDGPAFDAGADAADAGRE